MTCARLQRLFEKREGAVAIWQMDRNTSGLSLNSPRVLIALISEGSRGEGSWQGRVEAANPDFSLLGALVKRGQNITER